MNWYEVAERIKELLMKLSYITKEEAIELRNLTKTFSAELNDAIYDWGK